MFAETCKTLPDKPQLQFRIVLRRFRNVSMRRRSDGLLPFLFQPKPASAVPHGLETLAAGNGKQPGANRGLLTKARQGFVCRQEHVLSKILALVNVTDHVDTESHYRLLVTLYKGFQRSRERSGGQGSLHILITGLLRVPIHST